jgi:DNA-binding MarR family transcriptional regulator
MRREGKGRLTVNQKTSLELTREFILLLKQVPRLTPESIDGLTPRELELLVVLAMNTGEAKKALTVSGIGKLLRITPAGVTHLVNPLEESGYLERLSDPKDRRIVRIGLTAEGAREAAVILPDVQEKVVRMIKLLGEEDSRTLIRLLSRVIEHFAA